MKKIFDMNGTVFSVMTTVYQILALNIFFLLSGIWVVTTGAAITALYSCCLKIANHEPVDLFTDYKKSFKRNFKISTIIWGVLLVGIVILFAVGYWLEQAKLTVVLWIWLGIATIVVLAAEYLFPLVARFENTGVQYIRNAVNISFHNAAYSIFIFLISIALLVFFPVFIPKLFLLWLLMGFATTALINSYIFKYVFDKYDESVEE